MAKRVPLDCKRITTGHLGGLTFDQLTAIAQRIETQTQALNRARRLVAGALADLHDPGE